MSLLDALASIVPPDRLSTQADQLTVAGSDESSHPPCPPQAVVWPETADEIAAIVRACIPSRTPITGRGGGSALEGSAVPAADGIVVDLTRMRRIVQVWADDLQVAVEPGIIYRDLNNELKRHGLFFPPSPGGSSDLATVGGMVATNASGIYSVRYGGTGDYVLALDVVTGTGERVTFGSRAVKRSSGYNMVELMVGSEGTLGLITQLTLRLAGLPEGRRQLAYQFPDAVAAARSVSEIRRYGLDVAALEFLDDSLMRALNRLKGYGLAEVPALFCEIHGPDPVLESTAEMVDGLVDDQGGTALVLADEINPWEVRHWSTEAVKHYLPNHEIIRNDVAFPISSLPEIVAFAHDQATAHDVTLFTFGHVGMGLLHALMLSPRDNASRRRSVEAVNRAIIDEAVRLGGSVSGEHGIGLNLKESFAVEQASALPLMRAIKKQFDPHGIMNPGKIFD